MIAKRISPAASLIVFSDDWGRHPSSCQHLVRQLLPNYRVLWVNTIGTRAPRLNLATARRVGEKLSQWMGPAHPSTDSTTTAVTDHHQLTVVNPRMWPWFGRPLDRRFNSWLLSRQLTPIIKSLPQPVAAVTTLPITADLPGLLPVDKWVYYCVDDFGAWPGLDGNTLRDMDAQMVQRADEIVAVSEHLRSMIAARGRTSSLLTHGVDPDFWQRAPQSAEVSQLLPAGISGPLAVFWGVVDRRLNSDMIRELSMRMEHGHILLIGPQQDPDQAILQLTNVHAIGPLPFEHLPAMAAAARVLIMPYADLPVTRAMQPLKMKEYMATGKPVVVSRLPAVQEWQDCLDVTSGPDEFAQLVLRRMDGRLPPQQRQARSRLDHQSWAARAELFEQSFQATSASNAAEQGNSHNAVAEIHVH